MCGLTPLGQALPFLTGPKMKGLASSLPPSAKRMTVFRHGGSGYDHGRLAISGPTRSELEPLPELLRLLLAL